MAWHGMAWRPPCPHPAATTETTVAGAPCGSLACSRCSRAFTLSHLSPSPVPHACAPQTGQAQHVAMGQRMPPTAGPSPSHPPVQVKDSSKIAVGEWVRLWQPASDNTRRRRLLAAEQAARGARRLAQAALVPAGKVSVLEAPGCTQEVPRWFEDDTLQVRLGRAPPALCAAPHSQTHATPPVPGAALTPPRTLPAAADACQQEAAAAVFCLFGTCRCSWRRR